MKKWTTIASYIVIIILAVSLYVQHQSNRKTIDALGSVYLSNIESFKLHINHVQTYLQNEKEFKDNDLRSYYYEVNYLLILRLPSQSCTEQYIGSIQSNIHQMESLVSENANKDEMEAVRKRTLQLLAALGDGIDKMSNAGRVKVENAFREDYKKYYQLSLPDNKTMQQINNELQKQLDLIRSSQN